MSSPTKTEILALHRYFIWADEMRKRFDEQLRTHGAMPAQEHNLLPWMPYLYGALYVVAEGWNALGLSDPEIDLLLGDQKLGLLKRYRHGTFHYQREYHDTRFLEFYAEGANSARFVRELHEAFSRWFPDYLVPRGGSA